MLRYPKISRRHGRSEGHLVRFVEDVRRLALPTPGELGAYRGIEILTPQAFLELLR